MHKRSEFNVNGFRYCVTVTRPNGERSDYPFTKDKKVAEKDRQSAARTWPGATVRVVRQRYEPRYYQDQSEPTERVFDAIEFAAYVVGQHLPVY